MGLSAAEKNRRKRERKKREKEERRKQELLASQEAAKEDKKEEEEVEIEIEYIVEPILPPSNNNDNESRASESNIPDGLPPGLGGGGGGGEQPQQEEPESMESVLRRFHQRSAVAAAAVVTDAEEPWASNDRASTVSDDEGDYDDDEKKPMSKRKLREMTRPSVAELKRRVKRPDLVEAHDITATDPDFLIHLKSIDGSVQVPRHWGRKRKYLQGKRGFEKKPFQLPDFIVKTGITEIRDTIAEDEEKQSIKQKNRSRVNPKMGAMDVDYKSLYEAFFKYQTKPTDLTKFGDLYYEGKEMETSTSQYKPGGPYSKQLKEALNMLSETSPPPFLINMQRYGPPPSYPNLAIPGLNAPLPHENCQYGYHAGGWGKPPVDGYGRPLYGGNPFDAPGSGRKEDGSNAGIVTSDGKTIAKLAWGALPTGEYLNEGLGVEEESSSDEDSSDDDMEESDAEEEEEDGATGGNDSVMPPPPTAKATVPGDLRKESAGDETPMQLYQVLEQKNASNQRGGVFQSDIQYVVAAGASSTAGIPEGVESVLSKAIPPSETAKQTQDDEDEGLGKNFKF